MRSCPPKKDKNPRPRDQDRRRSEDILVVTNQDRTRTITLEEEIVPRKSEIKIDCNAMPLRGKCFLCTQPYTGGFGNHLYSYHHKKIMLWSCNFCGEKRTKKEDLLKHMYDKHRGHSGVETREAIRKTVDKYPVVEVVKNKFFQEKYGDKTGKYGFVTPVPPSDAILHKDRYNQEKMFWSYAKSQSSSNPTSSNPGSSSSSVTSGTAAHGVVDKAEDAGSVVKEDNVIQESATQLMTSFQKLMKKWMEECNESVNLEKQQKEKALDENKDLKEKVKKLEQDLIKKNEELEEVKSKLDKAKRAFKSLDL